MVSTVGVVQFRIKSNCSHASLQFFHRVACHRAERSVVRSQIEANSAESLSRKMASRGSLFDLSVRKGDFRFPPNRNGKRNLYTRKELLERTRELVFSQSRASCFFILLYFYPSFIPPMTTCKSSVISSAVSEWPFNKSLELRNTIPHGQGNDNEDAVELKCIEIPIDGIVV